MPIDDSTQAFESPKTNGIAGRTEPISVATAITRAFRTLRLSSERYCPAPIPTVAATAIPIAPARILGAVALVARRPATTPSVEVIPSNDPKIASLASVPPGPLASALAGCGTGDRAPGRVLLGAVFDVWTLCPGPLPGVSLPR